MLAEILSQPGFGLLVFAAVLAGLVRGFTGFGTALVFLPFAGQVLPPTQAIVALLVIDLIGPLPAVPGAWRDAHKGDVAKLGAGALFGAPIGVSILLMLDPAVFRSLVSFTTLGLVVILVAGLRYRGAVTQPLIYGTGFSAGVVYGITGLPGPPVILFYMARPLPVAVIRASVLLFLVLSDMLMISVYGVRGLLVQTPLLIGLCLTPPYILALLAGSWAFNPAYATLYRWSAYAVIAIAAIAGLPLWD